MLDSNNDCKIWHGEQMTNLVLVINSLKKVISTFIHYFFSIVQATLSKKTMPSLVIICIVHFFNHHNIERSKQVSAQKFTQVYHMFARRLVKV